MFEINISSSESFGADRIDRKPLSNIIVSKKFEIGKR
jgi:hypothetical protein